MIPQVVSPKKITPALITFARELVGPSATPFYIRIDPVAGAQVNRCHFATADQVKMKGGQQVFCWTLWSYAPFWFEAEFHSVWKDTKGTLHDITPDSDGESRRLIVLDSKRRFEGFAPPKRYKVLHKDPRVTKSKTLYERANLLRAKYSAGELVSPSDTRQILAFEQQASQLLLPFYFASVFGRH